MMVDDEEEVQNQLDRICGKNHDLFLHTRVPRRRAPMETIIRENGGVDVLEGDSSWRKDVGIGLEKEVVVRSKILTHTIKGKISFMPMETILMIPRDW
jgi:hypothetical protein